MAVPVPATPLAARRRARLLALGAITALTLTACASAAPTVAPVASPGPSSAPSASGPGATGVPSPGTPTSAPSAPSPSAGQGASLLLEARRVGGFINPAATIGAPSTLVIDTDGRIYTPTPSTGSSTPMIPVIDVRDTGSAGAAAVLAAALEAGLGTGGSSGVAGDAGTTVFTLEKPDGSEVVTRVAAAGPAGPGGPGGSGGSSTPGSGALALLAKLADPAASWPPSSAPATPYQPSAYEVWVAPEAAGGAGAPSGSWPLAIDPNRFGSPAASDFGIAGLRSGVVMGDEAAALASKLSTVAAGSDLAYQGHAYRVWVRPMLPDELAS